MDKTELDWHTLSAAERKELTLMLYGIMRKSHGKLGGRFDDLFEQAQGVPLTQGIDPYSNTKRGVYDRNLALSRFRASPSARLDHFPFESDGAFPAQF